MSSTFYIDANRQNSSVKSNNTNAEWEYKLSNNIQLPAGTEVSVQDVFINKQGFNGATIEIEEDINETLYFNFYLSDNPHFVPRPTQTYDQRNNNTITDKTAYVPTFKPFGILNNRAVFGSENLSAAITDPETKHNFGGEFEISRIECGGCKKHNGGKYYGEPNAAQRIALWEDDGGKPAGTGGNNPRLLGGEYNNIQDPYISGYSEYPMMACFVSDITYATRDGDIAPEFGGAIGDKEGLRDNDMDTRLPDPRFQPFVKSVDIFIKKGVYSIAEIADLVENQINGKYTNLKNDDYYTDTIINKQNSQTYQGNLDTDGVFQNVEAIDRYAKNDFDINDEILGGVNNEKHVNFSAGPDWGTDAGLNFQLPTAELQAVFSQEAYYNPNHNIDGKRRFGPDGEPLEMFPHYNPSGLAGLHYVGFNDAYGLPYYGYEDKTTITHKQADGTDTTTEVFKSQLAYNKFPAGGVSAVFDPALPEETMVQSKLKGRRPALPNKKQLFYIPVHYYNKLVKMWKYEDDYQRNTGDAAHVNSVLFSDGNFAVNLRRMFRYGFQTRCNAYGSSTTPANGLDMGDNDNFIGLHYVAKVNGMPDIIVPPDKDGDGHLGLNKEERPHIGVSPANFQYDIFKGGYYVGTPDFQFNYDTDLSAFTMKGLHQSKRVPSADMRGNPMVSEGEEVVYVRRQTELIKKFCSDPKRTKNLINNFANPPTDEQQKYIDRYNTNGGEQGFIDKIESVLNNNEDRVGGIAVYNWAYQTALKLGDVKPETFMATTDEGMKYKKYHNDFQELWTFQDFFSSEEKARQAWETTLWARLGFTYDNLQNPKGWEKVPYYDLPVDKYTNAGDTLAERMENSYYEHRNKIHFYNEDFILPGKTTKGEIGLDSASTISTTFNTLLYSYTERQKSGAVVPKDKEAGTINQLIRTYDNSNVSTPYYSLNPQITTFNRKFFGTAGAANQYSDAVSVSVEQNNGENPTTNFVGGFDSQFSFDNSMYISKARIPVLSSSKQIVATKLPKLSREGYYIITSDLVDFNQDEIKQGQPLPMLAVVPISNLSNQDFITSDSDIIHTFNQAKNLNSIKIKVLNPDLTLADLEENSSIVIKITTPLPNNTLLDVGASQKTIISKDNDKEQQQNPHDRDIESGAIKNKIKN